jgi:Zn-finger nucleic acid-binding protein
MKCPVDNTDLVMTDRQGVEIDYCPQCRGVWLDRGELDKIIDRAAGAGAPAPRQEEERRDDRRYEQPRDHHEDSRRHSDDDDDDYRHNDHGGDPHKKRKKEGFLGDMFDF